MTFEQVIARTAPAWTSAHKEFYRLEELLKLADGELAEELRDACQDWKDGHAGLWMER